MRTWNRILCSATLALGWSSLHAAAQPVVVFGLTNMPLGQAVLTNNIVGNLHSNGTDGVRILLGEADGGVFAYPDTIDEVGGGDYMLAKVYGKLNGVEDQLLCTVRGRKILRSGGDGVYPVALDFSPLGVTNFFAQILTGGGDIVKQGPLTLPEAIMRTDFNGYKVQRVNPFWRTPDGGVAVVLDFPGNTGFEFQPRVGEDDFIYFGRRLVLRAINPTGVVDYVSRVDITTGGGVDENMNSGDGLSVFHMNEVRPVVFSRAHKALGVVALHAAGGRLKVSSAAEPNPGVLAVEDGVAMELARASKFEADLLPVDLTATAARFDVSAIGRRPAGFNPGGSGFFLGLLRVWHGPDGLVVQGYLPPLGTNEQQVRVAVYAAGSLVGEIPEIDGTVLPPVSLSGSPRPVRASAWANGAVSPPALGVTFDAATTFMMVQDGVTNSFTGDEVRLVSTGPIYLDFPLMESSFESLEMLMLNGAVVPELTITEEREEQEAAPRLTIARAGAEVVFTWPDANRVYAVVGSDAADGGYQYVEQSLTYTNHMATGVTGLSTNGNRFFRLVRSSGVD
jgi:hypothetical protein